MPDLVGKGFVIRGNLLKVSVVQKIKRDAFQAMTAVPMK